MIIFLERANVCGISTLLIIKLDGHNFLLNLAGVLLHVLLLLAVIIHKQSMNMSALVFTSPEFCTFYQCKSLWVFVCMLFCTLQTKSNQTAGDNFNFTKGVWIWKKWYVLSFLRKKLFDPKENGLHWWLVQSKLARGRSYLSSVTI